MGAWTELSEWRNRPCVGVAGDLSLTWHQSIWSFLAGSFSVTRVVLVDPQTMLRESIREALDWEPGIEVLADVSSADELDARCITDFDIVFIDPVRLSDGMAALDLSICDRQPDAKVVLLTDSLSPILVARTLEAGVSGIINKSEPMSTVISAVRRLRAGYDLLSPRDTAKMLRMLNSVRQRRRETEARINRLTNREIELLRFLAEGLHDRQIAERLSISNATVRTHMVNLYEKLGVTSRLEALVVALRAGIVRIPDTTSSEYDGRVLQAAPEPQAAPDYL